MKTVTVTLTSVTPYSQSKQLDKGEHPKLEKETHDDYEKRLWREKATQNDSGVVCIPMMALKQSVDEAVKRLSISIPGRGKTLYTKFFAAGVNCYGDGVELMGCRLKGPDGQFIHKDDMKHVDLWQNADGTRGSAKRVIRRFPLYPKWTAEAVFVILDDTIPKDVFERALTEAGKLVGIGRFRPEKGGYLGRFEVSNVRWQV